MRAASNPPARASAPASSEARRRTARSVPDTPSRESSRIVSGVSQTARAHLPKGLAKSAIIARITKLPPLAAPEPTPASEPTPAAESFSVAGWAKANGKDGREIRKQLRQAGKRAPYSRADVEALA